MSRLFTITLLLLLPSYLIAQVKFKDGYYIDKNKQNHHCFLLNPGVENKGDDFVYKVDKDSVARNFEITEIIEFGVAGEFRFIRSNISIDVSSSRLENLNDTLNHKQLESGHTFLLELVRSEKASLYYFFYGANEYYFYNKGNSEIKELIYKKYDLEDAIGSVTKVLYDKTYKKQLGYNLPCSLSPQSIKYSRKSLVEYVNKYIEEQGGEGTVLKQKTKGQLLIKVAGMYSQESFAIQENELLPILDFGKTGNFGYGLEVEYLFQYNRNKFGIFAEATYSKYSSSYQHGGGKISALDYQFIEIPIGLSCRFNLTEDFRLLVKAGLVPNLVMKNSSIYFFQKANEHEVTSSFNGLFSLGANYKRLNAEIRFYSNRNITQNLYNKDSEFGQFSARLSYTIFNFRK